MKLSAKTVAAASLPRGKADVIHFDDDLPGFGYRLRAGAGGKVLRSYVAQYRRVGATRRVLLGSAEVLTAEQARQAARKVLAAVALGQDPQADKADRRDKDRVSIRAVVDQYLAVKRGEVRPKTFVEIARYLTDKGYFGPLHGMPIDQVTQRDVASCLLVISQRGAVTTTQARSTLQAFYVWALHMGIALTNPVIGTRKPREAMPRERVLSDDELGRIWNGCGDDDYGRIIKLLILTGARRQEVGGMAWPEIDLERSAWTLPASRSKNKRSHTLPLPTAALTSSKRCPAWPRVSSYTGRAPARGLQTGIKGSKSLTRAATWRAGPCTTSGGPPLPRWPTSELRRISSSKFSITKAGTRAALPVSTIEVRTNVKSALRWRYGPITSVPWSRASSAR